MPKKKNQHEDWGTTLISLINFSNDWFSSQQKKK